MRLGWARAHWELPKAGCPRALAGHGLTVHILRRGIDLADVLLEGGVRAEVVVSMAVGEQRVHLADHFSNLHVIISVDDPYACTGERRLPRGIGRQLP